MCTKHDFHHDREGKYNKKPLVLTVEVLFLRRRNETLAKQLPISLPEYGPLFSVLLQRKKGR